MKKVCNNKEEKKLYFDKITKKFNLVWIIVLAFTLIIVILSFFIPPLHEFLWINIVNSINGFIFALLDFSPFLASNFYELVIIVLIIQILLILILKNTTKISFKKRNAYYNIINRILCSLSLIIVVIFILDFVTYGEPQINYKYFPDNVEKSYNEKDLIELANYFKDEIIEMSDDFTRDNGQIIYNNNLVDRATQDLIGVSSQLKFLKGLYPDKVGYLSEKELSEDDGSSLGYIKGYSVMVDKNQNNIHLLNTITHEFCHIKGIMKESEAEFCAFYAGIKSDDKLSNYSANYSAFYRITSVLSNIDSNANDNIEEEYLNLCLYKNYDEACNFYPKEVNVILNGNDYFEIETYRLRNYAMYEDNIIKILENLYHLGNAQFQINEKDIEFSDIRALINEESTDTLKIIIDFNDKFDVLSEYLNENQKYFKYIYQLDSEYEYENYFEKDEALEYYLKPFNNKTLDLLYNDEYEYEYMHERVVRLLLEYYY